jgi:hypothetical protein
VGHYASLDDVATSLVSQDVFGLIGFKFGRDRGTALEESWERRLPEHTRNEATLRHWSERTPDFARGTAAEPFPAFLFKSTIVESAQPVAFATTQLRPGRIADASIPGPMIAQRLNDCSGRSRTCGGGRCCVGNAKRPPVRFTTVWYV